MNIISRYLVIVLMSILTSGVYVQTSKTNEKEPEMVMLFNCLDLQVVKENVKVNNPRLSFIQKDHLKTILRTGTTEGYIWKDSVIVSGSQKGDEWEAYITKKAKTFYLTYIVRRNDTVIGILNIPLN